METLRLATWRRQIETELTGNILPFWLEKVVDATNGGFVGALTNELEVHNEEPRASVVCARILWTFAAAYRRYHRPTYLRLAATAYEYLTGPFWDGAHGGVYWRVDAAGAPVEPRKHSYAQAFAIYGLAEYHRATGDAQALLRAQELFALLERHAHDDVYGGYIEGCGPAWEPLADMRLSPKEPNSRKSMNTLLHVLEAYTTLLQVADDARVRVRLGELIDLFLDKVLTPPAQAPSALTPSTSPPGVDDLPLLETLGVLTGPRFLLYFDDAFNPLPDHISYGHDIEGAWLLVEAANVLGDEQRLARTRAAAVAIAEAVLAHGLAEDGSVVYARHLDGTVDATKHWWAQAEGIVGFVNAWQIGGDDRFYAAAQRIWGVIQTQFVDKVHGEWFKVLDAAGRPIPGQYKVGPWECPYHHARMCLELLTRFRA
jgi:mannobiose 2-epimerase